jgi:regulatory protein
MIVTGITKCGKGRFIVKLESGLSFPLYTAELAKFGTEAGSDLSDESLDEIMTRVLPARCIKRALNLLRKKNFAENELRTKLSDGGYPQEIVDNAIEYVRSYGYIDDVRYACDYIRYHSSQGRGKMRIRLDLSRKGISSDDFEKAWEEMSDLDLVPDSSEAIRDLLEKKHFTPDMDIKEKNRIIAFLIRRGYSQEDIYREIFHLT